MAIQRFLVRRLAPCVAFVATRWAALPAGADEIVVMTSGAFTAPFRARGTVVRAPHGARRRQRVRRLHGRRARLDSGEARTRRARRRRHRLGASARCSGRGRRGRARDTPRPRAVAHRHGRARRRAKARHLLRRRARAHAARCALDRVLGQRQRHLSRDGAVPAARPRRRDRREGPAHRERARRRRRRARRRRDRLSADQRARIDRRNRLRRPAARRGAARQHVLGGHRRQAPRARPRRASSSHFSARWRSGPSSSATGSIRAATAPADWRPLFNGRDLTGWTPKIRRHDARREYADTFRVRDGVLEVGYDGYDTFAEQFGHLFFAEPFSRYRLRIEYRFVGAQAPDAPAWAARNSGVMVHSQAPETMLRDQDFPISLEVQFLGGLGDGNARPTATSARRGHASSTPVRPTRRIASKRRRRRSRATSGSRRTCSC